MSFYDPKTEKLTDEGFAEFKQLTDKLIPMFKRLMAKGHTVREIGHLTMEASYFVEMRMCFTKNTKLDVTITRPQKKKKQK